MRLQEEGRKMRGELSKGELSKSKLSKNLLLGFACFLLFCCTENHSGTATQTTNDIALRVVDEQRQPVKNAWISIHNSEFVASDSGSSEPVSFSGYTDENGELLWNGAENQDVVVEILSGDSSLGALVKRSGEGEFSSEAQSLYFDEGKNAASSKAQVQEVTVQLEQTLSYQDTLTLLPEGWSEKVLIHLAGTQRKITVDENSVVNMRFLPRASYSAYVEAEKFGEDARVSVELSMLDSQAVLPDSFPWFGESSSMEVLLRTYLELQGLSQDIVEDAWNISDNGYQSLRLEEMGIEEVHPYIANLWFLNMLHLSGNPVGELPSEMGGMEDLWMVFMESTGVVDFPEVILQLPRTNQIEFSHTSLSSLPDLLENLSSLRNVFLDSAQFTEFPLVLLEMPALREIHLGGNDLSSIPLGLDTLPELELVNFADNRICNWETELGSDYVDFLLSISVTDFRTSQRCSK
jgi:hypothetical protein